METSRHEQLAPDQQQVHAALPQLLLLPSFLFFYASPTPSRLSLYRKPPWPPTPCLALDLAGLPPRCLDPPSPRLLASSAPDSRHSRVPLLPWTPSRPSSSPASPVGGPVRLQPCACIDGGNAPERVDYALPRPDLPTCPAASARPPLLPVGPQPMGELLPSTSLLAQVQIRPDVYFCCYERILLFPEKLHIYRLPP